MGVTAVSSIHNYTRHDAELTNRESGGRWTIDAGESFTFDPTVWIPWCTKASDFPAHHLLLTTPSVLFGFWQANRSDGDWVRYSKVAWGQPGPSFADPGYRVPGYPYVSGDRVVSLYGEWGSVTVKFERSHYRQWWEF